MALSSHRVYLFLHLSSEFRLICCAGAYLWAFVSTGGWIGYQVWKQVTRRLAPEPDSGRRQLLEAAGRGIALAPLAAAGFGALITRTSFSVKEVDIPVAGLPADLAGLRVLHLSDIHLSPFLSEAEFARVIDESNQLRASLALITGDLISVAGDPLEACINQLGRLRVDSGILGCMGNHETYARVEKETMCLAADKGIRFLRQESTQLRFGSAQLNIAGVDYQSIRDKSSYLRGAEKLIMRGMPNLLLSHNPDVFPVAAAKGFDVTLAGHTHGGQVTVELLDQTLNIARFFTPFVSGYYQSGRSSLYVTRGIGTIGLPVRIGAGPEITLVRLRCADDVSAG